MTIRAPKEIPSRSAELDPLAELLQPTEVGQVPVSRQVNDTIDSPNKPQSAVTGLFLGFNDQGRPLVDYPGNPSGRALQARSTSKLTEHNRGQDAVLLFEEGDPHKPIIIGLTQGSICEASSRDSSIEPETIELRAEKTIVLRCGDSSITLTRAGKVIIRGKYLLSSSLGVNVMKGGVIRLN